MLDIKNKLEIQDIIKELEDSKFKYDMTTSKNIRKGEITYLEIRLVSDDDEND